MFPDLRLLISATVATFFLAATAGLYASLRITQDQITPRNDSRAAIEDSPVARIAATWPMVEPDRVIAMRELMTIAKAPPIIASDETPDAAHRGDMDVPDTAAQPDTPAVTEDTSAPHATGSTGIAAQPEPGSLNQSSHPDIQGNIGDVPEIAKTNPAAGKITRPAVKKAQVSKRRPARTAQRRKQIARTLDHQIDPLLNNGYPLYLTVPITN